VQRAVSTEQLPESFFVRVADPLSH
jgi:hypothetical protein